MFFIANSKKGSGKFYVNSGENMYFDLYASEVVIER